MQKKISPQTRAELVTTIITRYESSTRSEKSRILDEFERVTGYHRKHAIRLLGADASALDAHAGTPRPRKATRAKVYDDSFVAVLVVLWEAADRISGKRLVPLLPVLLPALERHGRLVLDERVHAKLLAVSPATVDRLLRPARSAASGGRKRRRSQSSWLKRRIPVRTSGEMKDSPIGVLEIDLVCHGGETMGGSFVHTMVMTDIASGWTECVALVARDAALVVEGVAKIRATLPFPIRALDADNGGEFINEHLKRYCDETAITLTRSRPYQKNDQAWVEQKNGAIVRKMLGYGRITGLEGARCVARLYAALRLYVNFYQPSFKLLEKHREGARVRKRYLKPATPCDRLLASAEIDTDTKARLEAIRDRLDPIALLQRIRTEQRNLADIVAGIEKPDVVPVATDLDDFVQALATAFRGGEVRATHRKSKRQLTPRTYRTRPDPFAEVWGEIQIVLATSPDTTAKELFERLRSERPDRFSAGQLRTLQRRVREWRREAARELLALDSESTTDALRSVRSCVSLESNIPS